MKSPGLAALVFVVSLLSSATAHAWMTNLVDTSEVQGVGETSVTVDSVDKVHISYCCNDSGTWVLKYGTNASGSWLTEVVDADLGDFSTSAFPPTSIASDGLNKAHIAYAYYDETSDQYTLKYATSRSGVWVTENVDAGVWGSIALDTSDNVHIAYSSDGLKYATNASGSWVITLLDPDGKGGDVTVDNSDKVHISYEHVTGIPPNADYDLMYATNVSGDWAIEIVELDGGILPSIATDGLDNVHIAYLNAGLEYATNASGSWVTTSVDEYANPQPGWPSIALDSSNGVHIIYAFMDPYFHIDMKYASTVSDVWAIELVATGALPSISMDSADKAHISYVGKEGLMHAVNIDPPSSCAGSVEASTGGTSPMYDASELGKHFVYLFLPLGTILSLGLWRRRRQESNPFLG